MLSFGILYSLSLILFGLSDDPRVRFGGAVATLLAAGAIGYSSGTFVLAALCYVALTAWMAVPAVSPWLAWGRRAMWGVASLGLVIHAWPGQEALVVAEQAVLKPGSVPMSLLFHHDKVLVAWSLLGWVPLFGVSLGAGGGGPVWRLPLLVGGGLAAIMGLAMGLGLLAWQPGLPALFWVFAIANLLNTCVAEELVFRGLLQRWLMGKVGPVAAVTATGALFGIAHLAGGVAFVLVATAAGLLYGLVYWWTGRLVWSVLVHWGLNLTHLLLFSYPLLADA
ncbi:hypothetical protein BOX17_10550 [Halomonas aestuarii]|uniref:CAAX prenyl protease 2/Lysostaphin resistance protein A-like domain-containing protein n=1 Tax=Halomonas aestuarii TaxID=1897729 RepID=A0A1J0VH36_9GAMM|nr:CPBP family intramembrane glutamic endopeptidase [Halomonas aestuarii]APE31348.1 hypothetical protein BOX17_10550 [Halomonas aestuarii]